MSDNTDNFKLQTITNWAEAPEGVSVQLDLTEDAWEYGAPPPRGVYDIKLFPQKDGVKMGRTDKNDPNTTYYMINYEGRVVSENADFNDVPVFGNVSTRVFRGKNISTAAGLLVKVGVKNLPSPISDKKLAQFVEQILKKEVTVKAELDWRGAYSYKDPKSGEDVWVNVFNHYEEFPADPEKGGKKHMVAVASKSGGQAEVRAQLRVTRFFGKGDTLPSFAPTLPGGLVSGPRTLSLPTAAPVVAAPVAVASTPVVAAPQFVAPQQQQQTMEADLDLMLE